MRRGIGYIRVSGKKQKDGASLEEQEHRIREYALKCGIELVDVLQDVMTATVYRERTGLTDVRELVRKREVEVVLVWAFDRLTRNEVHMGVLLDELNHHGAELISVSEELDDTPIGKFVRHALAFAAELEREKIIDRTAYDMHKRARNGQMLGKGGPKYGYVWADEGKTCWKLGDPKEIEVVELIYDLYVYRNLSTVKIARYLQEHDIPTPTGTGRWHAISVRNILIHPAYHGQAVAFRIGYTRQAGRRTQFFRDDAIPLPDGTIPRIVSDELWYQAQAKLKRAKREATRNNQHVEKFLLRAGYATCGYCGCKMSSVTTMMNRAEGRIPVHTYVCPRMTNANRGCKGTYIQAKLLDPSVWERVCVFLSDLNHVREALAVLAHEKTIGSDVQALDRSIAEAEEEQELLMKDLKAARGRVRDLVMRDLNLVEDRLERLMAEKRVVLPVAEEEARMRADIEAFLTQLEAVGDPHAATYEQRRMALRLLGVSVKVYRPDDPEHGRAEVQVGSANVEIVDTSVS